MKTKHSDEWSDYRMSAWRQILISLCVLVIGGFLWLKFYPGAGDLLLRHGWSDPLAQIDATPVDPAAASAQPGKPPAGGGPGGAARVTTVVVKPAGTDIINDRVAALGTGIARQTVTVLPQAGGALTDVPVQSGATVTAGDVLARLDAQTQHIAYDKAKLADDDAKMTLERYRQLIASNAAPASQNQAVALAAHVAELNLRSAAQDLADRTVVAPISGVVGIINVSPGNDITTASVIATIVDSSSLLVNFWLPERLTDTVKLGDAVTLVPVARPQDTLSAKVVAIDNSIDPASGTFQLQAEVANTTGDLRPGMAFTVTMKFPGDSFVAVDPLAVQWGSQGAYVWRVTEGKIEKVMIRIMQRNTESVLVSGEVAAGDAVVTEGIDGLKAGATVQIAGAPPPNDAVQASVAAKAGATAPASN
ncbi:MAG: efflux RND transporter periplasmic adaptor subunit [Paracoccaceae bacterium]